jgi:multidrug resistance efflux pump
LAFLTFVGALIYGGCQIEFFQRVSGIAEIQLANARPVFATESGRITPVSYDGQFVEQGDTIATIENEDLVLEAMLTQQQIDDAKIKLSSLKLTDQTQEVAAQIEFWLKRKGSWERKLEGIRERQSDLVVVSPISGRLVVRTYDRIPQQQANEQLLVRDGEWTDAAHRGSHVKRGARLGYVGDPEVCRGIMNVSEHDIELVKTGQSVKLHLPCNDEFITGTITRISLENQPDRQNLPADAQAIDQSSAFYQIEFQFSKDDRVRIGAARKAVVLCRRTTFFDWATRWVYHSFWL